MAVLTDTERHQITNGLMRYWSRIFAVLTGVAKADIKAAVDATDDWIDTNQAAFNSTLPAAARTCLTSAQ